ncbi:MAG: hypothetical protein MRJ65_10820 [Candidatus Brocadiaceae bacterium]|nr:hypothetical protein [Candidatus Brocadiaceae bacterium]
MWTRREGLALDDVLHHFHAFQESQRKPIQENFDIQWQRLQQLICHAYDQVPYYRNVFEQYGLTPSSIKSPEDFRRIPLLTKEIIQEQGENLIARNYRDTPLIRVASGGSTGQPTRLFKNSTNRAITTACTWGYNQWIGWNAGDRAVRLWGSLEPMTFKKKLLRWGSKFCTNEIKHNVHNMEKRHMKKFEDCIRNFRPKIIIGYTNVIYEFAKYLLDEKRQLNELIGIVTTAETLFAYQRESIEKAFGCRVFNRYASNEMGQIAGECEQGNLHLNIPYIYFEFLAKDCPVEGETPGNVIVTDLTNYAMPIIRYQLGDMAVPDSQTCGCGRSLPLVRDLRGRLSDVIVTSGQAYIFADDIAEIFYPMTEIKQFQVVQQSLNVLTVKLVRKNGVGTEIDSYIQSRVQEAVGNDIEVRLQVVDDIPRLPSGKHRICISQIGQYGDRN